MSESVNVEIQKTGVKKWWFFVIIAIILVLIFIFNLVLSNDDTSSESSLKSTKTVSPISIQGKVLQVLNEGYRIDASEVKNDSNYDNIIVYHDRIDKTINEGDYISVEGVYLGTTSYKSTMGYNIYAHKIRASKIQKSTYIDAISPTIKEINLNKTVTQYGYSVTVQKVELAESETRVYLKIVNNGKSNFSLYTFNAVITQNGKQYEEQYNYDADYPKIQTDIRVGITSEGIITFPKLEQMSFKIILEGNSDNYREDIKEFVFDVEI